MQTLVFILLLLGSIFIVGSTVLVFTVRMGVVYFVLWGIGYAMIMGCANCLRNHMVRTMFLFVATFSGLPGRQSVLLRESLGSNGLVKSVVALVLGCLVGVVLYVALSKWQTRKGCKEDRVIQ